IAAARMPAFTGDIITSAGLVATTLATVNSNVGTFGDATHVAQITANAKGLITAVSNVTISTLPDMSGNSGKFLTNNGSAAAWSSSLVTSLTGTSNQITASGSTGGVTLSLPTAIAGVNGYTSATGQGLALATLDSNANITLTPHGTGYTRT